MRIRKFVENNYLAAFNGQQTARFHINDNQEVTGPLFPDLFDIKVTSKCNGNCPQCYMDSKPHDQHTENIVEKVKNLFGNMTENEKPFQIAYGGGEPTLHPDFPELLKVTRELNIVPNYTTNGTNLTNEVIEATKKYAGGVAISCHPHLNWRNSVQVLLDNGIFTNLHIIISDKESIDNFWKIYEEFHGKVNYFVLLRYEVQGRAEKKEINEKYLLETLKDKKDISDIAYGAFFYEMLKENTWLNMSLSEPEMFSKFVDLEDMTIYPSSFHINRCLGNVFDYFNMPRRAAV